MKGTFLSFDFVQDTNGDLKFLEMNTDTTANQRGLDSLNFSPFLGFLSSSNIPNLTVVYKPEIHNEIVYLLSSSAASSGSITTFTRLRTDSDVIYPTIPEDSEDTFILRMAYDENAIVDSTYCKNSEEPLKLLHTYGSQSLAVPFYYSGSVEIDTLTTTSNANNIPDVALKAKSDGNARLKFAKVADWNAIKNDNKDDYFITNYLITGSAIANGAAETHRHYSITYGSSLTSIDVGTSIQYGKLTLPTSSVWSGSESSNYILDQKHFGEFSTGIVKVNHRREGIYSTEKFVSASGEPIGGGQIQVGTELQTLFIPGLNEYGGRFDRIGIYEYWSHSGNTLPSGSTISTASAVIGPYFRDVEDRILYEVKPTDSTHPFYLGEYTSIITYKSSSNEFRYTPLSELDPDDDYLFDLSGSLVDIDYSNLVVLSSETGKFWTTDTEPEDNSIIYTEGVSSVPIAFSFHNK